MQPATQPAGVAVRARRVGRWRGGELQRHREAFGDEHAPAEERLLLAPLEELLAIRHCVFVMGPSAKHFHARSALGVVLLGQQQLELAFFSNSTIFTRSTIFSSRRMRMFSSATAAATGCPE